MIVRIVVSFEIHVDDWNWSGYADPYTNRMDTDKETDRYNRGS